MAFYPNRVTPKCNVSGIVKVFNAAKEKMTYPKMIVAIDGVVLRITCASHDSRNRGFLYVKRGDEYLGKIAPNGDFYGDASFAAHLAKLNTDPLGICTLQGKETKCCCYCGIELTDPRSIAMGYGPICAEKWGLPWGDEKVEPTVELQDLQGMLSDHPVAEEIKLHEHMEDAKHFDYEMPALAVVSKELAIYCEPHNVVPMTASEMAGAIMEEVSNNCMFYNMQKQYDALEQKIIHLLTTYPIRKE